MQTATETRVRRRKPAAEPADAPPMPAAYAVKLVRGVRYTLLGNAEMPERTFEKGRWIEVDEATYAHLADRAVDHTTTRDPEFGRVNRELRKFQFSRNGEPDPTIEAVKNETREFDDEDE